MFLANDPGVLLGLYYLFSAYGLADEAVSTGLCLGSKLLIPQNCMPACR